MSRPPGTEVSVMDIGGTHVTAASVVIDSGGVRLGPSHREPLDSHGSTDDIVTTLVQCARRLPDAAGRRWAIALPGPFDYEHGIGRYVGVGKLDALNGFDLRTALTARLRGNPAVTFCNDADAYVVGEWQAGAARGRAAVAGITLGTGVGSCFLRDGIIVRQGAGIPPGGRVDALEYAGKPLEETVSRRALRHAYARATAQSRVPDVRGIADRARQGDRAAAGVFTHTFRALGTALGPLLADFGPDVLVVGGSIAASWDLIGPPLREGIGDSLSSPAAIEPAQLPVQAPLLGAAYLAVATTQGAGQESLPGRLYSLRSME